MGSTHLSETMHGVFWSNAGGRSKALCMDIKVDVDGFTWNGKSTRQLWGPWAPPHSEDEVGVLRLYRKDDRPFDTCEIRLVGGFPEFYGLQRVFGTPYNRNIVAGRFALGDRIEIDVPDGISPVKYWEAMQE